ncbi:hypothetical protein CHUAL_005825 [Chamberlinius hualienensis]
MHLFHYTSEENLEAILTSKKIMVSTHPFYTHHGVGVYFTKLRPEAGRRKIFTKIRGPKSTNPALYAKTSHYICIDSNRLPAPGVELCISCWGPEVFIYRSDIQLCELGDDNYSYGRVDDTATEELQYSSLIRHQYSEENED